jgi:predicted Rossmann fold flavoprotein
MENKKIVVIGGGAAGFFSAITCAETFPNTEVYLVEKSANVLNKVRISGGGRCNVTNALEDPQLVASYFPRGEKQMIGPLTQFGTQDTMDWFTQRGVPLKVESDNRVFPKADKSKKITDALVSAAQDAGVSITTKTVVDRIVPPTDESNNKWKVIFADNREIVCDRVIVTAGGAPQIWNSLSKIGIEIEKPVASLFTFLVEERVVDGLAGISFNDVKVQVVGHKRLKNNGDILFTHWGLSGPVILKLSSVAARQFSRMGYAFQLQIDWFPDITEEKLRREIERFKRLYRRKLIDSEPLFNIPKKMWARLVEKAEIPARLRWAYSKTEHSEALIKTLKNTVIDITGKSPNKDEFVTCGGVSLSEVDFKTMQSTRYPGLFFAGEILDIDGLTGGFNFQAAWTTGYIAGKSVLSASPYTKEAE